MEVSKSDSTLNHKPALVEAPAGLTRIVAPARVVLIEDVEDEGP
ncbi:hypothetical protein [Streptomyces flavofungini]|nr:hypothetical protein [Streptomyces flavofungini]WJV51657.1 hypothetical protein QUY26_40050 [Streptomyces flavofungini]